MYFDIESLGSNKHISSKFVRVRAKKYNYVNWRLKSTPPQMLVILRNAQALLAICITFVLCCVDAVQNDQEKEQNGDGGKYSHKGYLHHFRPK